MAERGLWNNYIVTATEKTKTDTALAKLLSQKINLKKKDKRNWWYITDLHQVPKKEVHKHIAAIFILINYAK